MHIYMGGLPTPAAIAKPSPDDAAQILPGVGVLRKFPRQAARPGHQGHQGVTGGPAMAEMGHGWVELWELNA